MCGLINDAFDFVKDSAGEIFSHPGAAAGALFGVPGYDPFFGGLFNSQNALLSPTGNFSSGAWNDMYNANPGDSGALGLFHGVNDVADKIAPAAAGYFAAPALGAAMGGEGGSAAGIGADTFSSGLGEAGGASSLGGLESGMGGAAMFGPGAGTGTAIGSGVAQGMGAGGLGIAGGEALGSSLAGTGGTYMSGLGGSTSSGTGLGSLTNGGASLPQGAASPVDLGGSGTSMEGGQAFTPSGGGNPMAAGATGGPQGGNLSTLYGPESTAAQSPMGTALGQSTQGVGGTVQPFGATLGQVPATSGGAFDYLKSPSGIQDLFKLGQQGLGAYQQYQKGQAAKNYANSIASLYGPNSPYAQQMQQTLARQDAAAGRNSQGGTRAVQLAAALTQAQANALGNSNYAQAAQNTSGSNMLNGLFGLMGNTGTGARLGSAAFNGLSSLFGG